MAAPSISSSSPSASAVDVFLNVPLYVTFVSPGIDANTISANSVILFNVATQSSVALNLAYNPTTMVLTITPLSVLAESSVYKIRLPGTDVAISSSYVLQESGSGDPIVTTIDITFTTGTRTYIEDSVVDKDSTDLSLEGDLTLPSNVKALGPFAVETTYPKNHAADVALSIDGNNRVQIKFDKTLSGALINSDWVTVDAFPMLDSDYYLASGNVFGTGTIPSMTGLTYSGQYLYLNFQTPMPNNAGVNITLGTGIVASDGSSLGSNSYTLTFTTLRFPKVAGIHVMKTELLAASEQLNDDYLAAVLLKNTVRLMNRWPAFNTTTPQYIGYKYIINKAIVDVLDDKDLERALVAGTRKTLGDFSVSVDNLIGQLALKHKRAEEEADQADDGIQGVKKLGARIQTAIMYPGSPDRQWHGVNGKLIDCRFRYYQPNTPQANSELNRMATYPNPWFI